MTLVQLRHLIALAETGSFRRAAEAVFLTQPALTRSIQTLEANLGERLFERVGRRAQLTPFGRALLPDARRLVAEADQLKECAEGIRTGKAGTLRVGMGPLPSTVLTVPLLRHMSTHHPGVRVECHLESTEIMLQALREHRLDALIVATLLVPPANDIEIEPIAELRGGAFMCRAGHPLAGRSPLTFSDLSGYPIMALTVLNDEIARVMVERYGPAAHPKELVRLQADQLEPLIELAGSSDAILFAVRAGAPGLVELALMPALNVPGRFGLVTLAGRTGSVLLATVRGLARQLLRD